MTTTTTTPPSSGTGPEPAPKRGRGAKGSAARTGKAARTPAVASVNLLSPWVFEELRVHNLRRRFLLGGVVLVVAIALLWTALRFNLHQANEELRGEEAVGQGLDTQLTELTPVRTYVDSVTHRVVTVTGATYDDVAFSRVLRALHTATPAGASLDSIAVELAASESPEAAPVSVDDPARGLVGSTCPGPDPFGTKVVVGCVTISGSASSRDAVGDLVIALGADKLFVEPFVDTTTTDDTTDAAAVTFSGSVGLSPEVFSARYDQLGDDLTKGAKK